MTSVEVPLLLHSFYSHQLHRICVSERLVERSRIKHRGMALACGNGRRSGSSFLDVGSCQNSPWTLCAIGRSRLLNRLQNMISSSLLFCQAGKPEHQALYARPITSLLEHLHSYSIEPDESLTAVM